MKINEVLLMNDSFPPLIDGVSNTVVNYARVLRANGTGVCVATPKSPNYDDSWTDYPVFRYGSFDTRKLVGYMMGNPFSISTMIKLKRRKISLIHSHCPCMSQVMARQLRENLHVPLILTYHTKFDIDLDKALKSKLIKDGLIKGLVDNVNACDELWVVSNGAGENIRSLGYQGDYIVMGNGVDMPRHRASAEAIKAATEGYDLPAGVPVFLFVGRIMWYKGLRIILDALAELKQEDRAFRMVFIGGGGDLEDVKAYAQECRLGETCIFTGPIRDRSALAAWYSRADMFLFPSTYDTNGLVVREAAACSLGSVLIEGSCAAEDIEDGIDGILIEENAPAMAACLRNLMDNPSKMHEIGENAAETIYISWDDAIKKASERYEIVLENYRSGKCPKHSHVTDEIFSMTAEIVNLFDKAERFLDI